MTLISWMLKFLCCSFLCPVTNSIWRLPLKSQMQRFVNWITSYILYACWFSITFSGHFPPFHLFCRSSVIIRKENDINSNHPQEGSLSFLKGNGVKLVNGQKSWHFDLCKLRSSTNTHTHTHSIYFFCTLVLSHIVTHASELRGGPAH